MCQLIKKMTKSITLVRIEWWKRKKEKKEKKKVSFLNYYP